VVEPNLLGQHVDGFRRRGAHSHTTVGAGAPARRSREVVGGIVAAKHAHP
jgi:hypothetical protein